MYYYLILRILRKLRPTLGMFELLFTVTFFVMFFVLIALAVRLIWPNGIYISEGGPWFWLYLALFPISIIVSFLISSGIVDYIRDYDKPELTRDDRTRIRNKYREIRDDTTNPLSTFSGRWARAIEWRQSEEKKFKKDPDNDWGKYR